MEELPTDPTTVDDEVLVPPIPKAPADLSGNNTLGSSVDEAEFGGESRARASWRDKEE